MKPTLVDLMRAADDLETVMLDIDWLLSEDDLAALHRILAILRAYINERK